MLLHVSVAVQALPPPATPLRPDGRLRRVSDDAPALRQRPLLARNSRGFRGFHRWLTFG